MNEKLIVGTPIRHSKGGKVGKIIHIADIKNHPYGDAIYLIEWKDEGELFHGYMAIEDLSP